MNAATITRQSKSNLALAFISLGRERKRDITVFYAFCRVIDDIADSTELAVQKKARDLTASPTLLSIRGVAKHFGKNRVLRDISLNVAEGEFLTILGESGSGKTTLLRIIAG